MKVTSSAIGLNSSRNYSSVKAAAVSRGEPKFIPANSETDKLSRRDLAIFSARRESLFIGAETSASSTQSTAPDPLEEANKTPWYLKMIMESLKQVKSQKGYKYSSPGYDFMMQRQQFSLSAVSASVTTSSSGRIPGVWTREVKLSSFVAEMENTTFSSAGIVKTADGREITFDIDVEMSRSYMAYSELAFSEDVKFTDPLVINLGSDVASFSDQKFLFDLDADGTAENISAPGAGSGFLALDRNGDGAINDGSELFGAVTGDGFLELSGFDEDKNGWIDENDPIFDKLKVWFKGENGEDRLLSLKESGVGAIFLGKASTEFTHKNQETGKVNAQTRSTGIFLRENGQVGTIQHIDLAV